MIKSFRDLDVYTTSYQSMLKVMHEVIPKLPPEASALRDQLTRSCQAIPRLIAEGYAKRHQKLGFKKYLDDAMAEANETLVSVEQSRDIYYVSSSIISPLVDMYDKIGRQLYKLGIAWMSNIKTNHVPG